MNLLANWLTTLLLDYREVRKFRKMRASQAAPKTTASPETDVSDNGIREGVIPPMASMARSKTTKVVSPTSRDYASELMEILIGQQEPIEAITQYLDIYDAGMSPPDRPAGVFLLLGPTGTGKTRTVEVLAKVLHGSEKNVLRIDCGEFQMEHEVAKLIGAPPGYLGHRETQPAITQTKINSVASDRSTLSVVLFDEIEKAAPSMVRLLLGALDKGQMRLGDNSEARFDKTMVFLTSNLGSRQMAKENKPWGMAPTSNDPISKDKLSKVATAAAKRKLPPEFLNRIDRILTYTPLTDDDLWRVLDLELTAIQETINSRLANRAFVIHLDDGAKRYLLKLGTSKEYGARELKRTLHRHLLHPISGYMKQGSVSPGDQVVVSCDGDGLTFSNGNLLTA